jgi:hypothetical protein
MVLGHSLPIPFLSLAYKSQSRNLMSQVPPTFIINLTLLKIFPFFLANMVSCTVTSYGPQAAQANEDSLSESSLNLTLTQHPRDEELEPREVHAHLEVEPPRARYYRISPNSRTLMILLQVDPASGDEPETVYEGCYETEDTSIFAWSSILGVGHYRWLRGPICRLPLNSKADYLVRTIRHILDFCSYELWHRPGLNMYLQLLVKLTHDLNKCFNPYETHVIISTLSHCLFNH